MEFTYDQIEFISRNLEELTKLQTDQVLSGRGHVVEIFGPHKMAEMYKRGSERRLEIVEKLGSPSSYHDALSIKSCIEKLDRVIGQQELG